MAAMAAVVMFAQPLLARAAGINGAPGVFGQPSALNTLSFYNTHTRESVTVEYRRMGMPVSTALDEISRVMIDHRSGETHEVNPKLLDLLADIQAEIKRRHPEQPVVFHIISGYRAPKTNAAMRAGGGGQAKNSRHMHGDAVDIRVPGVATAEVRDIAYCLKRGGVGMYRGSDFVHVDVWNVRTWNWSPTAQTCTNPTS